MAPDMTFGPDGNQWKYSRSSKTYDLTRGSGSPHTVKTTYGPEDTYVSIAPGLSALVIVDMQNYFLVPSIRHHPTGLAAVEPTLRMIEKCRALGIQASLQTPPRQPAHSTLHPSLTLAGNLAELGPN